MEGRGSRRCLCSVCRFDTTLRCGDRGEFSDHQPDSINLALLLVEANPRSVVTIDMSSWLANST
jgi:hypothetical protein